MERDTALDSLLDLDGVQYVIGTEGYWVRFVVRRVPADIGRPHGLNYSLTSGRTRAGARSPARPRPGTPICLSRCRNIAVGFLGRC
jgi:hypothetical protein